ncbi:MAG: tetrathionate reductase family octaheme c-type cytochrome [Magnetococcales bacterium]|nr:tetrathionate reductase family octaheme c-type cytochrome [Magnetococcales bacterium]
MAAWQGPYKDAVMVRVMIRTLLCCVVVALLMVPSGPLQAHYALEAMPQSTTRHGKLPALDGPFASGMEVTRACVGCHTEVAASVRKSVHWTWESTYAPPGKAFGKKHVINAFCGAVTSNMRECTSCHIGYGWQDPEGGANPDEQVDCLVCHESTGDYKKYNFGYSELKFRDKIIKKPDFVALAKGVARPGRANCGSCHFYGGSGDGAKHGDLDSSLVKASRSLDIHMHKDGQNFSCVVCHNAPGHQITGSRYRLKAYDAMGIDRPGHTDGTRTSCASCHGNAPHVKNDKLNDHVDRVACQTCHVPAMARGGVPTMVFWDWRMAGQKKGYSEIAPEVADLLKKEGHLPDKISFHHDRTHGTSLWGENLVPRYAWFNGRVDFLDPKQTLPDDVPIAINRVFGSAGDSSARIWPFKKMGSMLPYDSVNRTVVINHLVKSGPDDKEAFEDTGNWSQSAAVGMKEAGIPFGGQVAFRYATMVFPLTHMVAPKELSLKCRECHRHGGRLEGITGVYIPGRDNHPSIHGLGRAAALLTLGGILIHLTLRLLLRRKRFTK